RFKTYLARHPDRPGQKGRVSMFGSFIRVASGPVVANGMLTFQITGSPLHALLALVGHALSGPQARQEGENDDV
ncbi:hypothetical protein, partial [Kozakia baliensis]